MTTTAFVALLVFFTLLAHPLRVIDEPFHADLVLYASDLGQVVETGWPAVRDRQLDPSITAARSLLRGDRLGVRPFRPDAAIPRDQRPTLGELAELAEQPESPTNRMTQHPPLYYMINGTIVAGAKRIGLADDLSFDQEIWLYRLINIVMLAPIPTIAYLIARRLSDQVQVHMIASLVPLGVPGFIARNAPMVNNDNLLVLLGGLTVLFAIIVVQGDVSKRIALALGVVLGAALLTKAFAFALIPAVLLAYGIAGHRHRMLRAVAECVVIVGLTSFVVGGWWWARNVILYGRLQPRGGTRADRPPADGFEGPDWIEWATTAPWHNLGSFWGGSYIFNEQQYPIMIGAMIILLLLGVLAAVVSSNVSRSDVIIALAVTVTLLGALYLRSAFGYMERGRIGGLHGRYLYTGLGGLAAVVSLGWAQLMARFQTGFVVLMGLGVVLSLTVTFWRVMHFWNRPAERFVEKWPAVMAWAPIAGTWVTLIAICAVISLTAVFSYALFASTPKRQKQESGGSPPTVIANE